MLCSVNKPTKEKLVIIIYTKRHQTFSDFSTASGYLTVVDIRFTRGIPIEAVHYFKTIAFHANALGK
jgi:hypothetical protein